MLKKILAAAGLGARGKAGVVDMLAGHFGAYKNRSMDCGICIKVCHVGR